MRERNHDFPSVWSALLIIGLLIGVEIIIAGGFYDAGVSFTQGDPRSSVIAVLGFGVIVSLLLSYKNLNYGQLFNPGGRSTLRIVGPLVLPILTMSFGTVILATEVNNLLLHLFPPSAGEIEQAMELFSGGMISVIALCLIAPFVEEMLFRGIFLRSFLRIYSPGRAIVLSSLLFGLAHLNVYQFVVASTLGVLSGWLYYATGSLWPAILEHAVYNGGVYLYAHTFPGAMESGSAVPSPVHPAPMLIFALAALMLGLWWLLKLTNRAAQGVDVAPSSPA